MGTKWVALTLALGSVWLGGCGGDGKGGGGGAAGRNSSGGVGGTSGGSGGGSAGDSGGSTGAGQAGTGGQAGVAGKAPYDPGLDCALEGDPVGVPNPVPLNGQCFAKEGDENGGARILSRSFFKTSLLADASGETIIYGELRIGPEPDGFGNEGQGLPRLVFLDRASLKIVSEITTPARPFPRAVSETQVVWQQQAKEGDELRLATRAPGEIAQSTVLAPAKSLSSTVWERAWMQGDQLFYEEDVVFRKELRRIALAGGAVTSFDGLLQHVVQLAPPLGIGAVDSFDHEVHVLQLSESEPAMAVGEPLVPVPFTHSAFTADASNAYALVGGGGASGNELFRMPLDGSAPPMKLGEYPIDDSVLTSDARFFVTHDARYVWLIPLSGGERIQVADFGFTRLRNAMITAKHLFVIVDTEFADAASYLVEVALPQ